jgi:CheY-like chemotaxis protein
VVTLAGYEAFSAATGRQAVEVAMSIEPDLILMGLRLPEMRGEQATAQLKANPKTSHIPIIIQTAFSVAEKGRETAEAGADAFVQKPVSTRRITEILNDYLAAEEQPCKTDAPPAQCQLCLAKIPDLPSGFCLPGGCEVGSSLPSFS